MTDNHIKRWPALGCVPWLMALANAQVMAADVDVYALGTYDQSRVSVDVWADINTPILSGGIKLTYDYSELTPTSATKNEADWFLGEGSFNHRYADPDTGTPGQVVIAVAKLDTNNPTAGVTGHGTLLGTVEFDRFSTATPVADPVDFFGFGLSLGREVPYHNFVTPDGASLDSAGVYFAGVTINAGDSEGDGLTDDLDNCPTVSNVDQLDDDNDGTGNVCDNCTLVANGPDVPDSGGNSQRDTDGDGYGNVCDADFNQDGHVTVYDYLIMRSNLNTGDPLTDLNGDGIVSTPDLVILQDRMNQPLGPSGLVTP